MSSVLIIGGHGKVALRLAPILTSRGDAVTSIIRNPEHTDDVARTGATARVADVSSLDEESLVDLFRGHDAIVWSAGAGGGDPERTYAVDRDAAIRSMSAAAAAGVSRYVMVSYIGSRRDHGVAQDDPFFAYAEAKSIADEHLRGTDLEWTILAPGPLTLEEPTGLISVTDPGDGRVTRADVAAVAAATLADPSTIRRTIPFGNGETPIAEAIRA
ncbi:MAG TPA: SDR family oxidoreductase [Candidatus Microbacterium stercoravium]|uniref:SDR family oxidoreductase n=1 Tax=Candidatus Microbacterium stercoravium TaxID=2838697 RepID=A0A9D2H3V5_9MICO|nr:SDR family oxidoreductase [Candidatus Microbacterium stercoravium]